MKRDKYGYLQKTVQPGVFTLWQEVPIEVCEFTDLGIKVAIGDEYAGLVYGKELHGDYEIGQKLKAYIKCVRADGKIDVSLQPKQNTSLFDTADHILGKLKASRGSMPFNDKSAPEDIRAEFKVSKKLFKQAIGRLYKQGKITITDQGIELVK